MQAMGKLGEKERRFLERRRRLTGAWNWVACLMLLFLGAMGVWSLIKTPALINPYSVAEALAAGEMERPVLEKHYLAIIDALSRIDDRDAGSERN